MSDDIRAQYHDPPPTPREEMWEAIAARIREARPPADVVDLEAVRRVRGRWPAANRWAAAAAVLVVGIALGRATAPDSTELPAATEARSEGGGAMTAGAARGEVAAPTRTTALDFAALQHLGRSESLLAMVRADAREGRIDPTIAPWARTLLMETRLLLDARAGADPTLDGLLAELELVLTQIVGVTEAAGDERRRTELDLTVGGMEERRVLARIMAAVPAGMSSE